MINHLYININNKTMTTTEKMSAFIAYPERLLFFYGRIENIAF